jgi:ribosomal protein L28
MATSPATGESTQSSSSTRRTGRREPPNVHAVDARWTSMKHFVAELGNGNSA